MIKHWILDAEGEPVETDLPTWAAWMDGGDNPHVIAQDRDESGRDILVSTIFLGIDHRIFDRGDLPPILWETMVLKHNVGPVHTARYTSRTEALAGHRAVCKMANDGAFD